MPVPKCFLIALTSDSDHKTLRFILSLIESLQRSDNRRAWADVVILRSLPYQKEKMLLDYSVASALNALNVLFLQPQVYVEDTSQYYAFLFSQNSHSYSTAAQRNRQLLAVRDLTLRRRVDLIAVLDDDLVFQNAILTRGNKGDVCVAFKETFDYFFELDTLHALAQSGPVAGGNSGCPPIPGLLGMNRALADRYNTLASISEHDLIAAQHSEYYYDVSNYDGVKGAWLQYCYESTYIQPSPRNIFWGVTPTRPLLFNKDALLKEARPSTRIGGNTYFAQTHELLLLPHLCLTVDGVWTRRSDMIVAEIARSNGVYYRETYFPLGHLRATNNARICKEAVCRVVESELFGVSFHRGIRSFLRGGDYRSEWDQMLAKRRDCVADSLRSANHIILGSGDDAVGDMCDPEYVVRHLVAKQRAYFTKYRLTLEKLDEILTYWTELITNRTYEIEY